MQATAQAQRGSTTCSRSHSWRVVEVELKCRQSCPDLTCVAPVLPGRKVRSSRIPLLAHRLSTRCRYKFWTVGKSNMASQELPKCSDLVRRSQGAWARCSQHSLRMASVLFLSDTLAVCYRSSRQSQEGLPGTLTDWKGIAHTGTGGKDCSQSATRGLKREERGSGVTCSLAAYPRPYLRVGGGSGLTFIAPGNTLDTWKPLL